MTERGTRGGSRRTRGPVGPRVRNRPSAVAARRTVGTPASGPRFTGRAIVLILVLAVLTVSYASSMRAYLQQRDHMAELDQQIAETDRAIEGLEREKRRWADDAFVEMQARERFGYVMPGEIGYQVIDEDGEPLDSPDRLSDRDVVAPAVPTAWWETAWESVQAAGLPEEHGPGAPAAKIQAPVE